MPLKTYPELILAAESQLLIELAVSAVWAAAGFIDTLLRCEMKLEVFNGNQKEVEPRVQA